MHLQVISSSSRDVPSKQDSTWVLRLSGVPSLSETPPPNGIELADLAAKRIFDTFPTWLWTWVQEQKALAVETWPGPVSWWWYAPISEMSPWRSPFIRHLYWLTLFECVLERHPIDSITWQGNDPDVAKAAEEIARKRSVPFTAKIGPRSWKETRAYFLLRRLLYSCQQLCCWAILRMMGPALRASAVNSDIALHTRYPILWDGPQERMYGTWPEYLQQKGHRPFFGAVYSGKLTTLMQTWGKIRAFCQSKKIVFLESQVSFSAFLAAHVSLSFFWKYAGWRRRVRQANVTYNGYSVGAMWWRQLDADALSIEIPFDRVLSEGWRVLTMRFPSIRKVFYPFEFQPMERAVWCGVKQRDGIQTVGLQAGAYFTTQMKMISQATHAPLPDLLAAYGDVPYKLFLDRLGPKRVFLCGPIRYPKIERPMDQEHFLKKAGLPEKKTFMLLAMPGDKSEAYPILQGALELLRSHPELFLLIKSHYHLPLKGKLRELAQQLEEGQRSKRFEGDLYSLMSASACMMTGGSSTSIEAMKLGCMPIIYRPVGELPSDVMLDVPEAAYFWSTIDELKQAVTSCLSKSADHERRRRLWPKAIASQISDLEGSPNERLYNFLH